MRRTVTRATRRWQLYLRAYYSCLASVYLRLALASSWSKGRAISLRSRRRDLVLLVRTDELAAAANLSATCEIEVAMASKRSGQSARRMTRYSWLT